MIDLVVESEGTSRTVTDGRYIGTVLHRDVLVDAAYKGRSPLVAKSVKMNGLNTAVRPSARLL